MRYKLYMIHVIILHSGVKAGACFCKCVCGFSRSCVDGLVLIYGSPRVARVAKQFPARTLGGVMFFVEETPSLWVWQSSFIYLLPVSSGELQTGIQHGVRHSVRGLQGFVESAAARLPALSFNQPVDSDSSGFLATMELPKLCWKPRREAR